MTKTACPKIIVYGPEPSAPPSMQYAAAMVGDGRPGSYWMSSGPTPEAARGKLEDMWAKAYPTRARPVGKREARVAVEDLV